MLKTWITNGKSQPFYARKAVCLPALPVHAQAWVCGLAQFNLYINGQKIGEHVLDPAWSDWFCPSAV